VRRLSLVLLLAAVGASGCGPVIRFYAPHSLARAQRDASTVATYTLPPPRSYDVLGTFHATQSLLEDRTAPELLAALQGAAAERGCDAIVVHGADCVELGSRPSLEVECVAFSR